MNVTTWSLQMLEPSAQSPRPFPEGVRLEPATGITPEYARFLYALVGGNWHWTDRLGWTRQQWADELAVPGCEFWILYSEGVPMGYVQLHPIVEADGTHVEILYFGLTEQTIGRGLGGRLLEHGIAAAWSLHDRADIPPVARVWVHTCALDGPAALANYQARGLVIYKAEDTDENVPDQPLGAWASTGGPAPMTGSDCGR
jgi:GNAT superfamily N-acetyltransferase